MSVFFAQKPADDDVIFAKGLRNIGNSCFLNSVLQAISSCPPFIRYLCDLDPRRDIPFTLGLKNCLKALRVKGDATYLTGWTDLSSTAPLDTSSLFELITAHNSNFNGRDQQDAQELLQTIFAMLAKDSEKRRRSSSNNAFGSLAIKKPSHVIRNTNPFEGWITSDLVCQRCSKHRPLKHQVFTDISLPFESIGSSNKETAHFPFATPTSSAQNQKTDFANLDSGPLIGGLPAEIERSSEGKTFTYHVPGLHLNDCLRNFMAEEILQQDVECQNCSWTQTLKAFERKSNTASTGTGLKYKGQQEEEDLNQKILKQFKTAMPHGIDDSCSLDLDDLLFSTDIDVDDAASTSDSISLPQSVRSNSAYATWRMRNGLGLASPPVDKSILLDSYLVQKVRTQTRKQLILSRPPPLLCLHICRRVADAVTGRMKKLNHHVSFPWILDIDDFVNGQKVKRTDSLKATPTVASDKTNPSSPSHVVSPPDSKRNVNKYLLRSVIVHTGSSEAGHYSTYCLMNNPPLPKKWMFFSDEQVRAVQEEDVLKSQAYMLFYERAAL